MSLTFLQSPLGQDPVIVETIFKASPQRLFDAWTTPTELVKWFGPETRDLSRAEIDLQIGGAWRFIYEANDRHSDILEGEYQTIEAPKCLVFSWSHSRIFNDGRRETTSPSQVAISFEQVELGTRMRLVHSLVKRESGRLGIAGGWHVGFERLIKLIG